MIDMDEPYDASRAVQLNTVLKLSGCVPAMLFGVLYHETEENKQRSYWKYFLHHVNEQLTGAKR